jgi:CRP-like cAMP-binding protein
MEGRLSLHRLLELVPATMRAFPAGAVIAAQGAPAQDLVVVLSGRVRVERTHPDVIEPLLVRELGAGDVAGEAALLERDILSATLLAAEPTTIIP